MDTNLAYFTNSGTIPKLLDIDREICDWEILESEILCSLKELKSGHSPCIDGLTSDFYKFFWVDIKILLVDSIKYSLDKGEMLIEQRWGIITLIHKKTN